MYQELVNKTVFLLKILECLSLFFCIYKSSLKISINCFTNTAQLLIVPSKRRFCVCDIYSLFVLEHVLSPQPNWMDFRTAEIIIRICFVYYFHIKSNAINFEFRFNCLIAQWFVSCALPIHTNTEKIKCRYCLFWISIFTYG